MPVAIFMPKLGMTMEEGTVVRWLVAVGSAVAKGEVILLIESEKNEVEIESSAEGFFRHIYVEASETVRCGALLGAITQTADEAFDVEAFRATEDSSDEAVGEVLTVKSATGSAGELASASSAKLIAPAARALARKLNVDVQNLRGTGPKGRITKEDVEHYATLRESLVPVGDGVSLEVLKEGEGAPVVLLPGLGTDVSVFSRQIPFLSERFCVHGVNPRGVGFSDAPPQDAYEISQLASDAVACFEGPAHVIGASLGAAVAMELALSVPERVASLVLITPFVIPTARLLAIAEGWGLLAAECSSETLASALLPWFFSTEFLADDSARKRTARGLAQVMSRVSAETVHRMTAGMSSWSGTRTGSLADIAAPTLVITAGEDLITPGGASLSEEIPNAKLLEIEKVGHAVTIEAPDAVNKALASHLK